LNLQAAAALNLTGSANSAWTVGGHTLAITSSNFNVTGPGAVTATSFSGVGTGLTALNASNISSGALAVAYGGTGSGTVSVADTNLGLGTGNSPQFTALTLTGNLDVQNAAPAGSTIQNSLGNLTISANAGAGVLTITSADFNADSTGIINTAIGQGGTEAAGTFTNLEATGTFKLSNDVTSSGTTGFTTGALTSATGKITVTDGIAAGATWTCTLQDSQITNNTNRIYITLGGVTANANLTVSVDNINTPAGKATIKIYNSLPTFTDNSGFAPGPPPAPDTLTGTAQAGGLVISFMIVQ